MLIADDDFIHRLKRLSGSRKIRKDAAVFYEHIAGLFGKEDDIRRIESTKPGLPAVHCFFYKDMPEPGALTMVTYGISEATHPDWKQGRPELVVSLDSEDMAWGMAAAYMAEAARGEFAFAYGQVLNFDQSISEESPMSAFFLFAPSFLSGEQAKLTLSTKTVFLYGAYPLHPGETEFIERVGLEKFWHLPGFDLYDVRRPDLSKIT